MIFGQRLQFHKIGGHETVWRKSQIARDRKCRGSMERGCSDCVHKRAERPEWLKHTEEGERGSGKRLKDRQGLHPVGLWKSQEELWILL